MCAWVPAAIAIFQMASQYGQDKRNAKASEREINDQRARSLEALGRRTTEVNEATAENVSARSREAMIERGRLAAIAASSGTTGASRDRLEDASRFAEGSDIKTLERNRVRNINQLIDEARGVNLQADSALGAIKQPSLIGTGLQIAGTAVNEYNKNEERKARTQQRQLR